MNIFGKIKDAIFGHKAQAATPAQSAPTTGAAPTGSTPTPATTQAASVAVSDVDVEHNLEQMAQGKNLNWRSSIVDLMKLVGIDSSLENRKELAQELGYTGALDGSAEMNIWLHKATMKELAANGGKVPAEMLD
jgi:hypothetical protein